MKALLKDLFHVHASKDLTCRMFESLFLGSLEETEPGQLMKILWFIKFDAMVHELWNKHAL